MTTSATSPGQGRAHRGPGLAGVLTPTAVADLTPGQQIWAAAKATEIPA